MRRSFALLLTALMLVFSLAACGGDKDNPSDTGDGNPSTGPSDGGAANGGDALTGGDTGSGGVNDGLNGGAGSGGVNDGLNGGAGTGTDAGGQLGNEIQNDLDQAGDNIRNGMEDLTGGTANGITANSRIGTSFDQMVRNGLVHDKDGNLTDNENSVTSGSDRF